MIHQIKHTNYPLAKACAICLALLWPNLDAFAQDGADSPEAAPSQEQTETAPAEDAAPAEGGAPAAQAESTDGTQGGENDGSLRSFDSKTLVAYKAYLQAAERYNKELSSYRIDLRHAMMTEYQNRLSSVDSNYAERIATLRTEEASMREDVIERMEHFLRRYGETHPNAADILYRLAKLHYEKADDAYLSSTDGSMEYPDFSITLDYIRRLQTNFPQYEQMDGVLYLKGYCLSQMGKEEEARDTFMTLSNAYPDSSRRAEVLTRIGEYYFSKSQDAILGLGGEIMWDEALKYYTEAVEIGQDSSVYDRALYRKAWTEYYTEDYDSMIKDFIALVGYADNVSNGSALRSEAIDFMAAALAEEDWDLSDNVAVDPDFGMKRFRKYLNSGAPFESEVMRKFADTLMEQTRYEHAAEAYEEYINRGTCSPDLPEVIRIYVAALN